MTVSISKPLARLDDLYGPIRDGMEQVRRIFDDEVRSDLAIVNELLDTVHSYRGKMLRPALLLLAAQAVGGVRPQHHVLGAVVEIVHMATLVHDDVLDDAQERRRRASVNYLAGNTAAVLLGDHLISHAFHLCSSLDSQYASRRIAATTNIVCEGELLQNHLRGRLDISEELYFDIIRRKTAVLTAVCCELGAHFADADGDTIESLRSFGLNAGIAFQIVDDVLDVAGAERRVGKTLGRDAELGKLTLPAIHCLAHADVARKASLEAYLGGRPHCNGGLGTLLTSTGSVQYAMNTAQTFVESACTDLAPLAPSEAKSSLLSLAQFITTREF